MNGVVAGGWSYVWAAYAITLIVLAVYGANVIHRYLGSKDSSGS